MPDEDVSLDCIADNLWLTGSRGTVADRITEFYRQTGGLGYLLITCCDAADEAPPWQRSPRPLTGEVPPACRRACQDAALAAGEAA
jgi:hypothetical protein